MKEMDISMEEKRNVNKNLLVIFKWTLTLIPMILAVLQGLNTIISYFGIHIKAFAHCFIFCLIGFIYIASYLLKFCEYHRMFLHYVVVTWIINTNDDDWAYIKFRNSLNEGNDRGKIEFLPLFLYNKI